ncbi:RagB/SusD family nutrient uptake outer membrane protein [Maribellus sp. CM-23]|uniref:RagB/SusD family nutrient uptake outer membrane protein n=1 Tax=Maribellus sp. CM-23 TaxID=2781026 RepID=UPI001F2C0197|nr:RagB/SusD family nutrient uptake outer membrane protein [Maribellus sp. CM-23]MCE4566608.1 RagB/SusD family nutrient uptake outer membrane protein [Maribellus sp. CM-23]
MKKIFIIIIIAIFSLNACEEGFLDLAPHDEANVGNFYKNANDFNTALIAAYAKLQSEVDIYFEMVEYRSDNIELSAPTAGTQDRYNLDKFQETSANGILLDAWAIYYNGILRCNEVISRLESKDFSAKDQYDGEARFLRALTYFNLVRFFGKVPIILEPVSPEEALSIGRSEVSKVYESIEDDLLKAISQLPASYSGEDVGRATSGSAKALLGKVYLTQKKYSEAKSTLDQLLGAYSLQNSVADVFSVTNKMNSEIIFAIRFNKEVIDEGHGDWFTISDVSISPITEVLKNAYDASDDRKNLIEYTQLGAAFKLKKFYDESSATTKKVGNDYIILRYADVLLMYAEALNEIGYNASGDAFKYLNEVHERAGLSALTSTDLHDQTTFRNAILKERQLEFPFEGHRWFDLVRTGTAKSEMSKNGIDVDEFRYIFPVPQTEIEKMNNKDIFDQNPGYN